MIAGDEAAGQELARRYYSELSRYFQGRVPSDEVDDLTQVTLLHTVAQASRFRRASSFHHYVFSVARRVLAERHRQAERRRAIGRQLIVREPTPQTSPSERLARAERLEELERALGELAEHYKVVLQRHLAGSDNFEIADDLELQYNTVRSRLSRAIAGIRSLLTPLVEELRSARVPTELEPST